MKGLDDVSLLLLSMANDAICVGWYPSYGTFQEGITTLRLVPPYGTAPLTPIISIPYIKLTYDSHSINHGLSLQWQPDDCSIGGMESSCPVLEIKNALNGLAMEMREQAGIHVIDPQDDLDLLVAGIVQPALDNSWHAGHVSVSGIDVRRCILRMRKGLTLKHFPWIEVEVYAMRWIRMTLFTNTNAGRRWLFEIDNAISARKKVAELTLACKLS